MRLGNKTWSTTSAARRRAGFEEYTAVNAMTPMSTAYPVRATVMTELAPLPRLSRVPTAPPPAAATDVRIASMLS